MQVVDSKHTCEVRHALLWVSWMVSSRALLRRTGWHGAQWSLRLSSITWCATCSEWMVPSNAECPGQSRVQKRASPYIASQLLTLLTLLVAVVEQFTRPSSTPLASIHRISPRSVQFWKLRGECKPLRHDVETILGML